MQPRSTPAPTPRKPIPRRTEIAKIANLAEMRVSFSKRRQGLFQKVSELCMLTSARAAVIVFSSTGRPYSFGSPSVEGIVSDYLRCKGDVSSPKGPEEWVDWFKKKLDSCTTEEDFDSLIVKGEAALDCVRKKLKDVGAADHSAVDDGSLGVHPAPTRSDLEGCEFNPNNFHNLFDDCISDGDHGGSLTLPENFAIGGGGSGKGPTHSDFEDYGYNPEDFIELEDLDVSL